MARVLVMMSGGVDSSVAAARLAAEGHEVDGVTLKLWGGETDSGCCSVRDVEDARRVAAQLGIAHYVFNFTEDFERHVVEPYADAYDRGATPNPCVECNRTMKFGRVLDRALQLGYDAVATGHHARVVRGADGVPALARAADAAKDQSYVLYMLTPAQLARTLLPVGGLTKAEVREEATRLGLRTAHKPDSMDVCFVARSDRVEFVHARRPARPGVLVDTEGEVVGAHDGVARFTVGQRKGLGVALGEPRFVVDVDAATATVTLGRREDLLAPSVRVAGLALTTTVPDDEVLAVQTRAHGPAAPARLAGDELVWETAQPRVARGQAVVLYRGDVVVGGGTAC